jgi:uncharacterized metal-binding protein
MKSMESGELSPPSGNPAPVSCSECGAVIRKLGKTNCSGGEAGPPRPGHCPTDNHAEIVARCRDILTGDGQDARLARVAARVEGLGYERAGGKARARWTRVEDTIAFARLMGYRRLGIATCLGLLAETDRLVEILEAQGLEAHSVCCKAGSIDKAEIGVSDEDKVRPGAFEAACNPIAQAEVCNRIGTDLNIIVGLCVGHDSLFNKHSAAPVTTLVVKDRVTGHNPVSVLYGQHYYRCLRERLELPIED